MRWICRGRGPVLFVPAGRDPAADAARDDEPRDGQVWVSVVVLLECKSFDQIPGDVVRGYAEN